MDNIEYFEMPELPGRPMFRCEKRRATLGIQACAALWTNGAIKNSDERFAQCKGCAIGAKHAGVGDATMSPIYATPICGRCGSGATRLIHGHLCPSCVNRQYEYLKGRNARGNAPVTHPQLHRLSLRYRAGGRVKVVAKANVVDVFELLVAVLRDEPKQATFTMSPPPLSPLPQMELFA